MDVALGTYGLRTQQSLGIGHHPIEEVALDHRGKVLIATHVHCDGIHDIGSITGGVHERGTDGIKSAKLRHRPKGIRTIDKTQRVIGGSYVKTRINYHGYNPFSQGMRCRTYRVLRLNTRPKHSRAARRTAGSLSNPA
jgi:hypothetical protein